MQFTAEMQNAKCKMQAGTRRLGGASHFLGRRFYGVRWQSEAATPLWISRRRLEIPRREQIRQIQSGVAPLFPLAAALHMKRRFAAVNRKNGNAPIGGWAQAQPGLDARAAFSILSRHEQTFCKG